uniref:Mitochondrial carrier protein n=1 Tax=Globodera rostochiensis TaxID=31243 RepID=A0A914HD80_GLORO
MVTAHQLANSVKSHPHTEQLSEMRLLALPLPVLTMRRTVTAPLDRLKVFLQVNSNHKTPHTLPSATEYLYREGGFLSFWRGNGINILKIAPESAIKFMFYEQIKQEFQRMTGHRDLGIVERFMAGASAGVIAQTAIYPLEVLKTRLALRRTGELGRGVCYFAKEIHRREGFTCFYRGYVANCIGIIPYAGIDLAVYETLKNLWIRRNNSDGTDPGVVLILGCGLVSSSVGQVITYPIALIRTKLQARAISSDPNQPATIRGQVAYIVRHEGYRGLYRGLAPNFMKVLPAVSISYLTYEQCRKWLGAQMT